MSRKIFVIHPVGVSVLGVETTDAKAKAYCFDNQGQHAVGLTFTEFTVGGEGKPRGPKVGTIADQLSAAARDTGNGEVSVLRPNGTITVHTINGGELVGSETSDSGRASSIGGAGAEFDNPGPVTGDDTGESPTNG